MEKEDNIKNNLKNTVDNQNRDNKVEGLLNNNIKDNDIVNEVDINDNNFISDIYGNIKINKSYNTDISQFEVSKVIEMSSTFDNSKFNGDIGYTYKDLVKRENIGILKEYLSTLFPSHEVEQVNKNTMLSSFAKFFGKKEFEQSENINVSYESTKDQKILRELITAAYEHADSVNDFLALDVILNHKSIPKLHGKNYKDFLVHWAVLEGNEKMVKQLFRLPIILNNFQRSSKIMDEDSTIIDTAKKVTEPNQGILEFLYTLPCHINEYKDKFWHDNKSIPNQDKIDAIHRSHFTRLIDSESGPARPLTFNDTLLKQITESKEVDLSSKKIEP